MRTGVINAGHDEESPAEQHLADMRGLMWAARGVLHLTWEEVAKRADLHPVTVLNLVYGDTRFPRDKTIWSILEALSTETVHKLPGRTGYVSLREFRGFRIPARPKD